MVSKASEDLPEPESPVTTTSRSRGRSSEMFLRLCSRAPRIEMCLEVIALAMSAWLGGCARLRAEGLRGQAGAVLRRLRASGLSVRNSLAPLDAVCIGMGREPKLAGAGDGCD